VPHGFGKQRKTEVKMPAKIMLSKRLSVDLIERIEEEARRHKCSVEDIICTAFDSLEREENLTETVTEKFEKISQSMCAIESIVKGLVAERGR